MKIGMWCLFCAAGAMIFTGCLGYPETVTPVKDFKLDKYTGVWYEIARIDKWFEKNLVQVTATYSLNNDGSVKVLNRGFDTKKKVWKEAVGKARFVRGADEAYFKVSFFGPFYGSYVVFELEKENYSCAFVSGGDITSLWFLSRSPIVSDELYSEFTKKAASCGFDTSKIIRIKQE